MPKTATNPHRPHVMKPRPRAPRRSVSVPDDLTTPFSIVDRIRSFRKPLSASELAPILGVSTDVLYAMVRRGDIPQLIIPGRKVTRFDPASIVFWLTRHNPILNQVQKAS